MTIKPGCIIPINYKLWPERSGRIVMAMVLSCEEQWFNLCPVHNDPEAAGHLDLVVMPEDTSLRTFMVVMGTLVAGFPSCALASEVFTKPSSPRMQALQMSDKECERLRNDVFSLAASSRMPDSSVGVLRGDHLPSGSVGARWARKLASEWLDFSKSAWKYEFNRRHLLSRDININFIIDEMVQPLRDNLDKMQPPPKPEPKSKEYRPRVRSSSRGPVGVSCGRIGELVTTSKMENIDFTPERKDTVLEIPSEKDSSLLADLRQKLSDLLMGNPHDSSETRNLLQGSVQDLLRLVLLLFPSQD